MSKYNLLWEKLDYLFKQSKENSLKLTFNEIESLGEMKIDHSFLSYKKELEMFGYKVFKISLKEKCVYFEKIKV